MKKTTLLKIFKIIGITFLLFILFGFLVNIFKLIFSIFNSYEADVEMFNILSILISFVLVVYLWIKGLMSILNKRCKLFSKSIRINLNKKDYILIISVSLIAIITCSILYFISNRDNKKEEKDVYAKSSAKEIKEELDFSIVDVGRFYDGLDGFSVSIPSGNISVCVWTYNAGSGVIPNLITTEARTATEKHTISVYGDEGDFKVSCVDDFGNRYIGMFPKK